MYNNEQQEAIDYFGGPLRIIAGAGSGKTRVVTAKIIKIIKEKRCQEWQILAITFTNKAANEMKTRVANDIGYSPMAHISTYHSLCLNILRQDIKHIGYPNGFTVIDGIDKKQIVKSIINANKDLKFDKLPVITKAIEEFKKNRWTVEDVEIETETSVNSKELVEIYKQFLKRLKENDYLDFDDLIYLTEELFEKVPEVREKWANKFKYIFVDEFQDTDNTQYNIVKYLSEKAMLIVVGDPDQTIYSWRGANANIINNLDRHYKDLKTIILHMNYRSPQSILDVANCVIKNNDDRIDKDLTGNKQNKELPYYYQAFHGNDEANWVVHAIENIHRKGVSYNDIVILFRAAYVSRNIEQRLISKNINYHVHGNVRFMERTEIKDSIAYLKCVLDKDDASIERVINVPSRKIGDVSIAKLWNAADAYNVSFAEIVFSQSDSWGSAATGIKNFVDCINSVNKNQSLDKILMDVLEVSGYMKELKKPSNESRHQNVLELRDWIISFFEENKEATHKDFFQEVSVQSSSEETPTDEKITLMTVHSAKGLEYKHVFVIGLNEGIFPSKRSIEENYDNLKEERRLFYVAVTRAMEQLYLSSSGGRSFTGDMMIPSIFIGEINRGFIQSPKTHEGSAPPNPTMVRETNMREKFVEYSNGDVVVHTVFGEGLVLNVGPVLLQIAFKKPHGVKTIKKQHKALSPKE